MPDRDLPDRDLPDRDLPDRDLPDRDLPDRDGAAIRGEAGAAPLGAAPLGAAPRARDLLHASHARLMGLLEAGRPIDPGALEDREYRGVSLGLPRFVERLSWKTFRKVFHRDPETGALRGWNVRVRQGDGAEQCFDPIVRGGAPRTFGHYEVTAASGHRMPRRCDAGLLIDYGRGGNGLFDPLRWLRDPIVALEEGSTELLLGWSYLELGFARFGTPSFFTLERDRPLSHVASPPRASGARLEGHRA